MGFEIISKLISDLMVGIMKNLIRITALVLLTLSILASNAYSADYYPLKEGMIWEYQSSGALKGNFTKTVIADSYMIGDVVTIQVMTSPNKTIYFIIKNKEGIFQYAKQKSTDIEPVINDEEKVHSFLYPIKIGTSWKDKDETYLLANKYKIDLEAKVDKLNETVITPAGIFEDCIRVRYYGAKVINDESNILIRNAKVSFEKYVYYAPNIGHVKTIVEQSTNNSLIAGHGSGTETIEVELTKFTK